MLNKVFEVVELKMTLSPTGSVHCRNNGLVVILVKFRSCAILGSVGTGKRPLR